MKSIAYGVLGCVFFSIMVYADPASKAASTSSLKSRSELNITNEAEYAEFVRKREGGSTATSRQSVASASSSSTSSAGAKK
jgi:hypothetical protein